MSANDKQLILINFFAVKGETFCPFQDFQGPETQIQRLSRAWDFLLPIPGLSGIFKDRGNPVEKHYLSNSSV